MDSPETMAQGQAEDEPKKPGYTIDQAIGKQNITPFFDSQKLDKLGADIHRDFAIDDADFAPRRERITKLYELALQVIDQKNYPFPNAANIKYPILTKAALMFAVMAYPAIVQGDNVVKGRVIGSDEGEEEITDAAGKPLMDEKTGKPLRKNAGLKAKKAERVGKFMSYQVLETMDSWEDDMDKILHIIPIIGCAFKKTYRDPIEKKNRSDLVLPQYLILNSDATSLETANRSTEIIDFYPHEIAELEAAGVFRKIDYSASVETKAKSYTDSNPNESAGNSINQEDTQKPHAFIEQHRLEDLDGDGYPEPYIFWVHKESQKVVRILPRFESFDIITSNDGSLIKINRQQFYTKIPFIPDPEGSPYDIGFGHLVQHLNLASNASINQLLDQGHLYTTGGGFIGSGLRTKTGAMRFRPNEWKILKGTSGQLIKDSIVPLPVREPSATLMLLLEFLIKAADQITSVSNALEGNPGVNTPAVTMMLGVEQGLRVFKAIFRRIHRSLKKEFKRLFYLNQIYLSDEEYIKVLDDPSAKVESDFMTGEADVIPFSDPEIVTNVQSMLQAQALLEMKDDPFIDGLEIRRRALKALNISDVDSLVRMPPDKVDMVAQAQVAALQAQILDLKSQAKHRDLDSQRKDSELGMKIEKAFFEVQKMKADTVKTMSEIDGAKDTRALATYETYVNHLTQLKKELQDRKNERENNADIDTA